MLEIKNISKKFGDRVIFNDFSCSIKQGDFVVFSGKSGSGKNDTFKYYWGESRRLTREK